MDCIFCKIVDKTIPADRVYEDDQVIAFADLSPQAPVHHLIIPREHIATLNDLNDDHTHLIGHMMQVAKKLAKEYGMADAGYRIVANCNADAGQSVFHIHLHLLGKRQLTWPPG